MPFLPLLPLLLLTHLLPFATAHSSNGLDPNMDMPMPLAHGTMTSFLHFTPGDTLWLDGWVPGRAQTLFGACVGLFLLGVAERWVRALRAGVEGAIRRETRREEKEKESVRLGDVVLMRAGTGTVAPFVVGHAWARFVLQCAQAALTVLFMLAVMTFQVSFILSIVIGLGVGEAMYGRFIDAVMARVHGEDEGREVRLEHKTQ
ncbi:putative ctr copper transporter family protein [Lyophyllum shimeji]|uniref:Copper transport protein n=1 Tax=Lyophyllum shimeji TaxID=47721 RepID=A0A9P3Q137_LYOSH|nr:putative ctr copper transporter family protein [Lyophyllum shimeji]